MTNQSISKLQTTSEVDGNRGILAFPNIDAFYSSLAERIWMSLERYFLTKDFILLITALPRNHEEGTIKYFPRFKKNYPYVFTGIDRVRELVKDAFGEDTEAAEVAEAWDHLYNTRLKNMESGYSQNGQISSIYFNALLNRTMSLNIIEDYGMGSLNDYFQPLYHPSEKNPPGDFQREEDIILKYYLGNYDQYHFISLPLVQFAEFDGAVHIIYHEDDKPFFVRKKPKIDESGKVEIDESGKVVEVEEMRHRSVGNVIKTFSFVYEEHILNWDFPNARDFKESILDGLFNEAVDPELYKGLEETTLLHELGYRSYYEKYSRYFRNRIKYTSSIPHDARELYRRIAIMNILIDSYTHNISAHSLVALESWFKQRAYFLDNDGQVDETNVVIPDIDFIRNQEQHFSHELHELVRFMLEKGAFWTGLNRDLNYGGKTSSLFEVIYNDFICNPLYLGTIAYSEGVTKLNVHITVLKKVEDRGCSIRWLKQVETDGLLASVNLKDWEENGTSHRIGKDHHYKSGFVTHGDEFKNLKERLERIKVFFPGGVVGKHALLTVLENEIRNIKHHTSKAIEQMREEGLTLHISIEDGHYNLHDRKNRKKPEYVMLGVWLGHKQVVEKSLFQERLEKLWGDIIDEHNNPRLGGLQQDKICAAFLFNNAFSKVQPPLNLTERDRRFYPWIKLGFSSMMEIPEGTIFAEWEISSRRVLGKKQAEKAWPEGRVESKEDMEIARRALQAHEFEKIWPLERRKHIEALEASRHLYAQEFNGGEGVYKKFLSLWCGEDIFPYDFKEGGEKEWENTARFRFIYLPMSASSEKRLEAFQDLRKNGSIRILDHPTDSLEEAYNQWFRKWIKTDSNLPFDQYAVRLLIQKEIIAQVYWDGQKTGYVAEDRTPVLQWPEIENVIDIKLTHGREGHSYAQPDECRFRNHGVLMDYFCKGAEKPSAAEMSPLLAAELLETITTRICMFDKRLVKWFEKWDPSKMESLGCEVYQEDHSKWQEIRDSDFFRYHFVVVHLSFIESMTDPNGQKYTEATIDKFIENEVLRGREVPENFFLVIASGRGRKQWQYTLNIAVREKAYFTFVTYRPLESLHSAAENSQMKLDDIETKHLLTKILIGS